MDDDKTIINKYMRPVLDSLLPQLTESQRRKFNRIFSKDVPVNKLMSAIALCERTIKNNRKENTNTKVPTRTGSKERTKAR